MEQQERASAKSAREMVDELRQTRDELRVRLHLLGMEAKDTFDELEKRMHAFEEEARRIGEEPMHELGESYAHLREAFRKLADKLRS